MSRSKQQQWDEIKARFKAGRVKSNKEAARILVGFINSNGVNVHHSIQYYSWIWPYIGSLVEGLIIFSPSLYPYVRKHPKAFGVLGDVASKWKYLSAGEQIKGSPTANGRFFPASRAIQAKESASFTDLLHEGIHAFSLPRSGLPYFQAVFGPFLYEGLTQLFTNQALADHGFAEGRGHDYGLQLDCARKLIKDATVNGPTNVPPAYFGQDTTLHHAMIKRLSLQNNHQQFVTYRNGVSGKTMAKRGRSHRELDRGSELCERLGYL